MSLSVAGVWAVGVWDQTVWADGVWREGPPTVEEEEDEITPSGGFWFAYDLEYTARRRKKEKLDAVKIALIKNKLDRELAQALQKKEKEQVRIEELRRLTKLATTYKKELSKVVSTKAIQAAEAAFASGTYSMMERMEREIAKSREEEIFFLEAVRIILNQ